MTAPTPHETTTSDAGPSYWWSEAEAHLREAARRLEVVGLVDGEAARMALQTYRLASRCRTDRMPRP